MTDDSYDVIVVGAGAAGLTAAGGCALYGLRTALIERDRMGGECLNTGCVPSKALLAAAAAAQAVRGAARFGIQVPAPTIDFPAVRAHIRRAITTIAPHDSVERMQGFGVDVIQGQARFRDPHRLAVGRRILAAPRIVLATGSRPAIPPIPGLADTPYLTNETLWDLETLPTHLAIIGAGPVGLELAQAFRRLGAAVTLLDSGPALAREDPQAVAILRARLEAEGVVVRTATAIDRVDADAGAIRLHLADAPVTASHLLVAAGRTACTDALDLPAAGIATGPDGIVVDRHCRTSAPHVFAIGDCRAGPRLTHAAGNEGTVAVQAIALGLPAKPGRRLLPRAVYTDPELAQLGATEAEARARWRDVTIETAPFADDDRAVAEDDTDGFVKLVRANGRPVGVTIVGAHAGELLLPWTQLLAGKASRTALASAIVAYPTRSERSKAVAAATLREAAFHPALKRWARLLASRRRVPPPFANRPAPG